MTRQEYEKMDWEALEKIYDIVISFNPKKTFTKEEEEKHFQEISDQFQDATPEELEKNDELMSIYKQSTK